MLFLNIEIIILFYCCDKECDGTTNYYMATVNLLLLIIMINPMKYIYILENLINTEK